MWNVRIEQVEALFAVVPGLGGGIDGGAKMIPKG